MAQFSVFNNLLLLISIIVMVVVDFTVFKYSKNKISNKLFAFFVLAAIVWVATNLMANLAIQQGEQSYLLWTKLALVGPIFMPMLFILFANSFPQNKLTLSKKAIWLLGILTFLMLIFVPTKFNVESVKIIDAAAYKTIFNPGILYIFFSVFLAISVILLIYILIKKYYSVQKNKIEKKQIRNVLLSIAITTFFALPASAILPLFGYSGLINSGPAFSLIFILITAYTILEYQFLNIKLIVSETSVYLIIIVLVIDTFFSRNYTEMIFRILSLALMIYVGVILIRSMKKEIRQREKLQKLTKELEVVNQKLKELDAMKTEFVSVASHELLTPISAIEGYLSMMLDEKMVKIDNPKAIEYLGNVYQSAKRLAKLVADLLNVSRIEQGRLLVEKTLIKMRNVIAEVRTELKFKAQDAKLDLNIHIPKDLHTAVYADADKIKEVLVNLCGNSLKFTKAGGKVDVSAEIWSTHKLKEKYEHTIEELEQKEEVEGSLAHTINPKASKLLGDNQLVISVKDTGMGISKEGLSKLFQKFSRVGTWSNHSVPGTGLGLYISKSLVEMHHGRIWAESEGEGKGSTFYFTLPLASAKKEVEESDKEALPTAADAKPLARTGLEGQIKSGSAEKPEEKASPATAEENQLKTEPEPQPKTLAGEDLDEKPKIKE